MIISHNGKAVSRENPIPVTNASSSDIYTDSVTVTTTAAAVGSQAVSEVFLQVPAANTESVFIGNDTDQLFEFPAGAVSSITLAVTNLDMIYAKTSANTATLNYLARG